MGDPDNVWGAAFFDTFIVGVTIAALFDISRHFPALMTLFTVHAFMVGVVEDRVAGGAFFNFTTIPGMVTGFTFVSVVFFMNKDGGFAGTCGISFSHPDDPGRGFGGRKCCCNSE